jgi:hypothetical protein
MFPPTRCHLQVIQIFQEYKLNLSFAYMRIYVILMENIRVVLLNTVYLVCRTQRRFILFAPYMLLHVSALSQTITRHFNTKVI